MSVADALRESRLKAIAMQISEQWPADGVFLVVLQGDRCDATVAGDLPFDVAVQFLTLAVTHAENVGHKLAEAARARAT